MLGIDLGTTFCAVATLDERGRAVTVPNRDGEMLTPSAVYLSDDTAVVGQAALDVNQESPDDVATLIKRRMGYPDFGRPVHGQTLRPETLSAIILKKLAQDATARLGNVGSVVVTVPAYFDDTRRRATQDAGRIAGLDVVDIFDEPCAAALSYAFASGTDADRDRFVLVYDLGGGTFDVTVVRISRKRFQTIAIEGDVRLGGHDWDARIVDFVAENFVKAGGQDPRRDAKAAAQLFAAAERAKRTLSKLPKATITISHGGQSATIPLSRGELETMTRDLLTRTRLTVQQVLKQASLGWDRIDKVLLVGGSTHMPMTRQMLRDLSGQEPEANLAVSEVVARGAALHAGIVESREIAMAIKKPEMLPGADPLGPPKPSLLRTADERFVERLKRAAPPPEVFDDVVEVQVNAHSLGVEVIADQKRINDILIPKNTQLPASASRVYRTVKAGQRQVRVKILQGEAQQAEACIPVGECWINDLPANLPVQAPVEVTCGCGENGLIAVRAKDLTSGSIVTAELRRTGGLSPAEIEAERKWLAGINVM